MQIPPIRPQPITPRATDGVSGAAAAPEVGAAQPTAAAAGADQIVFSPQAQEVRAAHEALAGVPDVRADVVARLKAQVEAGTLPVDPDRIAEKMVP